MAGHGRREPRLCSRCAVRPLASAAFPRLPSAGKWEAAVNGDSEERIEKLNGQSCVRGKKQMLVVVLAAQRNAREGTDRGEIGVCERNDDDYFCFVLCNGR